MGGRRDEVRDAVKKAVRDFETVLGKLNELRISRQIYAAIDPVLAPQYGQTRYFVGAWLRDHLLVGARAITDRGDDVTSFVRILLDLIPFADEITADLLIEGQTLVLGEHDYYPELVRVNIGRIVHEDGTPANALTRRAVGKEIGRIDKVAEDIRHFATHRIVHTILEEEVPAVGLEHIEELLDTLADIVHRWKLVLQGIDHDQTLPNPVAQEDRLARALALYDHANYLEQNRAARAAALESDIDRDEVWDALGGPPSTVVYRWDVAGEEE